MKRSLFLKLLAGGASATVVIAVVAGCSSFGNMRGNSQYGADQHMGNQVKTALEKDPLYKYPNVSVNVYRGEVQLGGVINKPEQREAAIRDASAVPGVMRVEDNMMENTNPPVVPQ